MRLTGASTAAKNWRSSPGCFVQPSQSRSTHYDTQIQLVSLFQATMGHRDNPHRQCCQLHVSEIMGRDLCRTCAGWLEAHNSQRHSLYWSARLPALRPCCLAMAKGEHCCVFVCRNGCMRSRSLRSVRFGAVKALNVQICLLNSSRSPAESVTSNCIAPTSEFRSPCPSNHLSNQAQLHFVLNLSVAGGAVGPHPAVLTVPTPSADPFSLDGHQPCHIWAGQLSGV